MNYFGNIYRVTTFGESHGPAVGGVIDGIPAGITVDFDEVRRQMGRRRPGASKLTTARNEPDEVEFLSGFDRSGTTLGSPVGFIIRNTDCRSSDYAEMEHIYRPNHADYTYKAKYGVVDYRGGGRASARATAPLMVAGAIAMQVLAKAGIEIAARLASVGGVDTGIEDMEARIAAARAAGDSVGGTVECTVRGVPAGLGEPLGDKLHAMLAKAMMGINAAKGFEYGDGFAAADMTGSKSADCFYTQPDGSVGTRSNHSGGIQGGISNGADIVFRIAFKPTPTIARPLNTITDCGNATQLQARGRHDPCVALRAVSLVEAMAAIVLFDASLMARCSKLQ